MRLRLWACRYFRLPLTSPLITQLTDEQLIVHYDTEMSALRAEARAAKGLPPLDDDDEDTVRDDEFDEYLESLGSPTVAAPDAIDLTDTSKWTDA